ncbi:MAG: SDR family oxidoreductase, partial [Actinobacteria bacterium]|nr:SDR family oxidoreductase [Actinomycetota bacterium]
HGDIDIVVNLAGILAFENSHDVGTADWQRIIDVNLTGTFLVCRQVLAHFVDPGRGRTDGVIVNTASTAAHIGQAWSAAYCASKGAVASLTRALAVEYAGRGIRVNSVSPGAIQTPIMNAFAFPEGADHSLLPRTMPLMPMGTPEEAAAAITYLASDEARYVNGADLRVDGATTA